MPSYKVLGNLMNIKKLCEKILNLGVTKLFIRQKIYIQRGKGFSCIK